ncbi:3,4-dihydroxy-2-butanone-4-phosphate synthase [Pseudonocardia sp. P1]
MQAVHSFPPDRVTRAVQEIAAGRPVIVTDDADREDEGDLIFAAEAATAQTLAFTVRYTSGFVCVALPEDDCDRLDLSPMHGRNGDRYQTAYQVTVDLAANGTGISASARARTIAALASERARASDFVRPGHVVPLRARSGGVLVRPGHTEAAVDLARLAGMRPAGALCEIVSEEHPGQMARGPELVRFAGQHGLVIVSISELMEHRKRTEPQVVRRADAALATDAGRLHAIGYRGVHDNGEHLALVAGDVAGARDVPVYVHVECLTGDVLGARSCGCGAHLERGRAMIAANGGVLVYVRPPGGVQACGLFDTEVGGSVVAPSVSRSVLADLGVVTAVLIDMSDSSGDRSVQVCREAGPPSYAAS